MGYVRPERAKRPANRPKWPLQSLRRPVCAIRFFEIHDPGAFDEHFFNGLLRIACRSGAPISPVALLRIRSGRITRSADSSETDCSVRCLGTTAPSVACQASALSVAARAKGIEPRTTRPSALSINAGQHGAQSPESSIPNTNRMSSVTAKLRKHSSHGRRDAFRVDPCGSQECPGGRGRPEMCHRSGDESKASGLELLDALGHR